jgi:hypothetical protein
VYLAVVVARLVGMQAGPATRAGRPEDPEPPGPGVQGP